MNKQAAYNHELHKQEFPKGIKGAYKAYKLMYDTDKATVLLYFPTSIIRAVRPYLTLFVTGYILNEFASDTDFLPLLYVVLGFVVIQFILHQLEGYIEKHLRVRRNCAVRRMYLNKAKKYMHIDYELLDGPVINEINQRIERDNNWGSFIICLGI